MQQISPLDVSDVARKKGKGTMRVGISDGRTWICDGISAQNQAGFDWKKKYLPIQQVSSIPNTWCSFRSCHNKVETKLDCLIFWILIQVFSSRPVALPRLENPLSTIILHVDKRGKDEFMSFSEVLIWSET